MASGKIKQLKDTEGNVFPIAHAEATYLSDGATTVQQKINELEKGVDLQERASVVYNSSSDSIDFIFN